MACERNWPFSLNSGGLISNLSNYRSSRGWFGNDVKQESGVLKNTLLLTGEDQNAI